MEAVLIRTIVQGRWRVGERLPAERLLSAEFNVSRNTLRGVLKRLDAKGMVSIRRGSGCYLRAIEPQAAVETLAEDDSLATVMARFEAAYLFLPSLVALAAARIDPATLRALEISIADLGTAIIEKDMGRIKDKTRDFFCIIAGSTQNQVISDVVHPFIASSSLLFPRFFHFSEDERAKMFGDFVYIFHGLKNKDPEQARRATLRKIFNTASAFSKLTQVPLSPVIRPETGGERE